MRLRWLFSGMLGMAGALLLSLPAEAARLLYWNFSAEESRLSFTTDAGVQPRAQLIFDPTRVVIDLPGTTLGQAMTSQIVGEGIREVRVGQFDRQTTRIVIELEDGYTIDPLQVQVQGTTANQWSVQLPPLQSAAAAETAVDSPSSPVVAGAATQLERLQITRDGFFIRASGETPEIEVERSRDRRQVTIDLENTAVVSSLLSQTQAVNEFGVTQMTFSQLDASPPIARITLDLEDEDSPGWGAVASNLGGVVLLPDSRVETARDDDEDEDEETAATPIAPAVEQLTTIQAIALQNNETQLVIQADQPITYTSGWDSTTTDYRITISNARLAEQVTGPQLSANSPILRLRVRQETADTVAILVQPTSIAQIGELNQPNQQVLALELQQRVTQIIPVSPPDNPSVLPNTIYPSDSFPSLQDGETIVIIDPGHGGPDPGAIGIDGLQEKGVVLSIATQVAALLNEQGVQAVLTRSDDRDLGLEPRVALAEQINADLFVSIHANAIDLSRPDVNGIETYYASDAGLELARVIHANVVQSTGSEDRGVRQARFYVLVNTSMPAVLLETGFVTGEEDAPNLSDSSYQRLMAESIVQGILQYIQQNL